MRVLEGIAGPIADASTAAIAAMQAPTAGTALTLKTNFTYGRQGGVYKAIGVAAGVGGAPGIGGPGGAASPQSGLAVYSFKVAGIPASQLISQPYTRSGGLVTLTGTTGLTAHNYIIVGLDRYGNQISEVLLGPAGATTVTSVNIYGTVISITPSTTSADDVSAGYAADSFTRWIGLANFVGNMGALVNVSWDAAATATYIIETTDYPMNTPGYTLYGETPPNIAASQASGTTANTGLTAAFSEYIADQPVTAAFVRAHFTGLTGGNGRIRVIPTRTA
jgi:hypothetical protein